MSSVGRILWEAPDRIPPHGTGCNAGYDELPCSPRATPRRWRWLRSRIPSTRGRTGTMAVTTVISRAGSHGSAVTRDDAWQVFRSIPHKARLHYICQRHAGVVHSMRCALPYATNGRCPRNECSSGINRHNSSAGSPPPCRKANASSSSHGLPRSRNSTGSCDS